MILLIKTTWNFQLILNDMSLITKWIETRFCKCVSVFKIHTSTSTNVESVKSIMDIIPTIYNKISAILYLYRLYLKIKHTLKIHQG